MESLPENISYSPISVPGLHTPLLRRDLFDARFQLYSRDDGKPAKIEGDETDNGAQKRTDEDGEEYVDSSTDLVPGLYEGGLKTWEGGVDLVEVLNGVEVVGDWLSGSSVLEVRSIFSPFLDPHVKYWVAYKKEDIDIRSDVEPPFLPLSSSLLSSLPPPSLPVQAAQKPFSIYKITTNLSSRSSPSPISFLRFYPISLLKYYTTRTTQTITMSRTFSPISANPAFWH